MPTEKKPGLQERDELLDNLHGSPASNGSIYHGVDQKKDHDASDNASAGADDRGMEFDDAMRCAGSGPFHALLLALCGWAVSSDAIQVLSISFILPAAACDLDLDDADDGLLTSTVFAGMMVGGYFWGILADHYGRRHVLVFSLMMGSICTVISSFCGTRAWFIFWCFWAGIGSGGSLPVVFTYFAEFQSAERRGTMICVLAAFWMCGNILSAGLAWAMITRAIGIYIGDFAYSSWRIYLTVCAIPAFTGALSFLCLPESPLFLYSQRRVDDALSVLCRIRRINHTCKKDQGCMLHKLRLKDDDAALSDPAPVDNRRCCWRCGACVGSVWHAIKLIFVTTVQVFRKPYTKISLILTFINFTISYGYFGMYTWFPQLFEQMTMHPGPVCQMPPPGLGYKGDMNETQTECVTKVPSTTYYYAFLTALALFPGNLFSALCIERTGRRPLILGSMVIAGCSVFLIALVNNTTTTVVSSCLFGGILVISYGALDVLTLESYPTHLRSTVFGFQLGVGKLAGIAATVTFGELLASNCYVPMFMVAVLLATGGLSVLGLSRAAPHELT